MLHPSTFTALTKAKFFGFAQYAFFHRFEINYSSRYLSKAGQVTSRQSLRNRQSDRALLLHWQRQLMANLGPVVIIIVLSLYSQSYAISRSASASVVRAASASTANVRDPVRKLLCLLPACLPACLPARLYWTQAEKALNGDNVDRATVKATGRIIHCNHLN